MQHTFRYAAISLCLAQMNTSPPARQLLVVVLVAIVVGFSAASSTSSVAQLCVRMYLYLQLCVCVYVLISSAKAVSSAPQFVGVLGVAYLADISFVQWTANFRCRRCSVRPKNIHNNNNSNHNTSEKSNYNNFATIFYVFSCFQFLYFSLGVVQFTFICSSQTQIQLRIWNWNIGKTIMNFCTCRKIHIYPLEHTLFILQETNCHSKYWCHYQKHVENHLHRSRSPKS